MTTLNGLSAAELNLKHELYSGGVDIMTTKRRHQQQTTPIPIVNQTNRRRFLASSSSSTAVAKSSSTQKSTSPHPRRIKPSLLHAFLFQIIIVVFKLYQFVQLVAMRVVYSIEEYLDLLGLRTIPIPNGSISAAPQHVCIILNESVDDEKSLRRRFELLIDVMSSHGTRLVSVYEPPKNRLLDAELKRSIVNKYSVNKIDANNNDSKGVQVKFLTKSQAGKSLLVDTCKILAAKVQSNKLKANEISQKLIDRSILELSNMPEPELIISIGDEDTLAGFSPWHIRLSEIIKIQSFTLINKHTIYDLLERYGKIEKRFGK